MSPPGKQDFAALFDSYLEEDSPRSPQSPAKQGFTAMFDSDSESESKSDSEEASVSPKPSQLSPVKIYFSALFD